MLSPTGLIPWFSKTVGNTYATLLHHRFLFKGKLTHAQEVARRISGAFAGEAYAKSSQDLVSHQLAISGAVAGEIYAQVKAYQVPITNSYPSHYIICRSPLVFSPPLHPFRFICSLFLSPWPNQKGLRVLSRVLILWIVPLSSLSSEIMMLWKDLPGLSIRV